MSVSADAAPGVRCPACEAMDTAPLAMTSQQPIGRFEIRHCNRCEHRYLPDPPSDEELRAYYDDAYVGDPRWSVRPRPAWRDRPLVRRTVRHLPRDARLLEIGSGFGQTLLAFPRSYRLAGIELSASGAEAAARDPRLHIRRDFFERVDLPAASYDCVVALAVIEHVRDPLAFLGKIRTILRPGGLLVLMTGDYGSWYARHRGADWHLYHAAGHLHFFNSRSLEQALARTGLIPRDRIWSGPTPLTHRLPGAVGRLLHCQTTSLLFPGLLARRGYGDIVYVWAISGKTGGGTDR